MRGRKQESIGDCFSPAEIHKGKLQLYLFTKVVDKALAWATGRRIARAVGYIYVESYGMDREEEVDGVRFVIRYRV